MTDSIVDRAVCKALPHRTDSVPETAGALEILWREQVKTNDEERDTQLRKCPFCATYYKYTYLCDRDQDY